MSRDSRSTTQRSVLVGDEWSVICHVYKLTSPILAVSAGSSTISISVRAREDMPPAGVDFARQLARGAERFVAECERLHALHRQASTENGAQETARLTAGIRP